MRLEASELRTFRAVIEQNGFNNAAAYLHITQSAVSQCIANLEVKLETQLIRRGKQLKLTAAGKRLFEYALYQLREEQQALEDIQRIKAGEAAVLSLAINSTINRFYAPQLLYRFCQQQPQARLKIEELPSRSIIYAVLSGRTELGMGPLQKQMSAHETQPLFEENRYLVVSPKHAYHEAIVSADDKVLKRTRLITSVLDDPEMRPAMQRIRDRFATVWEISSLSLRINMVNQGLGVAYIDDKLLREHHLCQHFLRINEAKIGHFQRQVGIYYREGKLLSVCAREFIELSKAFWDVKEPEDRS